MQYADGPAGRPVAKARLLPNWKIAQTKNRVRPITMAAGRFRCRATSVQGLAPPYHANACGHDHEGPHQDPGQHQQPQQFAPMRCPHIGADQQTTRPENHAGGNQGRTEGVPPTARCGRRLTICGCCHVSLSFQWVNRGKTLSDVGQKRKRIMSSKRCRSFSWANKSQAALSRATRALRAKVLRRSR